MAKAMVDDASTITIVSGAVVLLLMLLFILLLVLLACKPWRFLSRSSRSRAIKKRKVSISNNNEMSSLPCHHPQFACITLRLPHHAGKADDLERPLVSEDLPQNQSYELARDHALEAAYDQSQGALSSLRTRGLPREERFSDIEPHFDRSDSFVLEISEASEDIFIGQTLKRPLVTNQAARDPKHGRKEDTYYESKFSRDSDRHREIVRKNTEDQRRAVSILALEVISGPSHGLRCSVQSTNTSRLPLTLGRVSPSDLLLKDSEVSGKHAMINWNLNKLRWELVDMGSLNGTLLNSLAVGHPDSGSRHWSDPIELASGDIITVGTTSKIFVQITSQTECQIPFGFGVASDPMALRRGGKKLPMEDVCYYHWPLSGADQFGLFGICDGHGGASAATSASKIMPEMVASILSDSFRRERVLSQCDASDVLTEAFSQTEACMNHYYEGCTATVLLVWADGHDNFFAQCANVGDSACVMNIDGKQIKMTEDHRIVSCSERLRIEATGEPLKEGETRLCGLNLGRMLGDKFLKQQDARFSTEPYISQAVCINRASKAFVLLASDGFWDVISFKKAVQIVNQTREKNTTGRPNSAEKIASILLSEARTLRTKDNTSIIFLDFDTSSASTIHSSKT